jgi:hypothetical protein
LVVVAIAARYKGYRYPIEVIGHAVWLYQRFALSLRDVEELMLGRGVVVTYETIRSWCAKFGPDYAARLRRRRPRPGDKWHLDEVFVKARMPRQKALTLPGSGPVHRNDHDRWDRLMILWLHRARSEERQGADAGAEELGRH